MAQEKCVRAVEENSGWSQSLNSVGPGELETILTHNPSVFWINPPGGIMGNKLEEKDGRQRKILGSY